MSLGSLDYIVFAIFFAWIAYIVVKNLTIKQSSASYFMAGKKLHWAYIGTSLIAADISVEYLMGSASSGFEKGLAIGSYEWTASITLIFVALYIIPKFMRIGILTLPEYLELRFDKYSRLIMSITIVVFHIVGGLSFILYSSAVIIEDFFGYDRILLIWMIATLAGAIILSGGLSAIIKIDMVFVIFLLIGGIGITTFSIWEVGGINHFVLQSEGRMHAILPADDDFLPWTQVFIGSLWIMHIYYWAFNQFTTQTMLVSDSLSQAQKGILLAASLKLIIPFLFVIPGIVGYELYGSSLSNPDEILPMLIRDHIPIGFKGIIIVSFAGTVIGASNALLNASTTIFTHDIYKRFIQPDVSEAGSILVSRIVIALSLISSCIFAPYFADFGKIFEASMVLTGAISTGIVAVFLFGLYVNKTPAVAATTALMVSIPSYFLITHYFPNLSSMDVSGLNFIFVCILLTLFTVFKPLKNPVVIPDKNNIRFERNLVVVIWSIFIITFVISIYVVFF